MQAACRALARDLALPALRLRVGVHVGTVVTGIVGSHRPRFGAYSSDLAAAEALQSVCSIGEVLVSPAAHAVIVACAYGFAPRGGGGGGGGGLRGYAAAAAAGGGGDAEEEEEEVGAAEHVGAEADHGGDGDGDVAGEGP